MCVACVVCVVCGVMGARDGCVCCVLFVHYDSGMLRFGGATVYLFHHHRSFEIGGITNSAPYLVCF